uniref:C2 domain-containing protein n=1 Tax=Electrophorus electricus TaxID=8005 RepID=A0AAY5EQX8_ELEEL
MAKLGLILHLFLKVPLFLLLPISHPLLFFYTVSESDLYVTLHLPTASACTLRTTCIPNSSTPEWNETFHFRVHSQVKVSKHHGNLV